MTASRVESGWEAGRSGSRWERTALCDEMWAEVEGGSGGVLGVLKPDEGVRATGLEGGKHVRREAAPEVWKDSATG